MRSSETIDKSALSVVAANAVQNHWMTLGGYGRSATSVTAREDKNTQIQWDTEVAYNVTVRDVYGQKERWRVIVDSETREAMVAGMI